MTRRRKLPRRLRAAGLAGRLADPDLDRDVCAVLRAIREVAASLPPPNPEPVPRPIDWQQLERQLCDPEPPPEPPM